MSRASFADDIDFLTQTLAADPAFQEKAKEKPKVQPSKKIDGKKVFDSNHPPPVFLFEGLLHNGLTAVAGRPKIGKSWLALQLAIDAAIGRSGLAKFHCPRAESVLYYGLEESESRTKNRMLKLVEPGSVSSELLMNIQFVYELLPLMGGGLEVIEADLQQHRYGLVVIDTLSAALGGLGRSRNSDAVAEDYKVTKSLQALAQKYQTAILLVCHTRKAGADNSIDKVSGTTGITAGPDAVWILDKGPKCITLEIIARDMESAEYAVHMNTDEQAFGWTITGGADEARTSGARSEILELLEDSSTPMMPNDIAKALGKNRVTVRRLLSELRKDSRVARTEQGYRPT